jgi:hypothetical protein
MCLNRATQNTVLNIQRSDVLVAVTMKSVPPILWSLSTKQHGCTPSKLCRWEALLTLFERFWFRMSSGTPDILTEVFHSVFQPQ